VRSKTLDSHKTGWGGASAVQKPLDRCVRSVNHRHSRQLVTDGKSTRERRGGSVSQLSAKSAFLPLFVQMLDSRSDSAVLWRSLYHSELAPRLVIRAGFPLANQRTPDTLKHTISPIDCSRFDRSPFDPHGNAEGLSCAHDHQPCPLRPCRRSSLRASARPSANTSQRSTNGGRPSSCPVPRRSLWYSVHLAGPVQRGKGTWHVAHTSRPARSPH